MKANCGKTKTTYALSAVAGGLWWLDSSSMIFAYSGKIVATVALVKANLFRSQLKLIEFLMKINLLKTKNWTFCKFLIV